MGNIESFFFCRNSHLSFVILLDFNKKKDLDLR
ncbi:hypothetical protein SAMN05444275_11282 [Myroides odoratimimus subsp. xuanwuensis]|nr:hypothetical protein SAMN05444275_11282 [Myroides odoratimimus subsp. xuanwuensis]